MRYYDHKLTAIEKGKLLSTLPKIQKSGEENTLPLSTIKDKRLLSILQTETENNVPDTVYQEDPEVNAEPAGAQEETGDLPAIEEEATTREIPVVRK